jgi:ATP-dependent RNA helicase SUPV3L1/SUV3
LTAVLGPTNTGKTHLAIERMLGHRSGMIGLPLRLLAREVYDKIIALKGNRDVALITGEERIVPPRPRYYVCTVEAMPVDIAVAFLAIDEIQLCADPERGHIFTDRLLHARGLEETMLLGSGTMRGVIRRMAPGAHFLSRPRFSDLTYTGSKKLTRLPRRSAVVAFSTHDVYGLADLVRAQRGGAAVVLGALSPRTRNAQVDIYQSGDADFLIATDAIGMGINMDVDHVAFAALEKFDGAMQRPLKPDEIGQIAGRAGRYMNDGTFGTTADANALEADVADQVESHRYEPVRVLQWRNSSLDFSSIAALLATLEAPPPARGLTRARMSSDHWALRTLSLDDEIKRAVGGSSEIKLMWETCQLPDFRKLTADEHTKLVAQIFGHLLRDGALPDDWLARQIRRLDIVEGDVDTLSGRLAQIRTWTYAAHRPRWTRDPAYWQETTRAVEDRLSDALHEKLTQRFIDRRTSLLMRRLREEEYLAVTVDDSGAVEIGGEYAGKLQGFRFAPDPRAEGIHGRTLRAATLRGLEAELAARARALIEAKDDEIHLSEHGQLWWRDAPVAKLESGAHPLTPSVIVIADDLLKEQSRLAIQARLDGWTANHIGTLLEPLVSLRRAGEARGGDGFALSGLSRGLAFQLTENLGWLNQPARKAPRETRVAAKPLRRFGVRAGRHGLFIPRLLKSAPAALVALLWAVHRRLNPIPAPPAAGLTSFAMDEEMSRSFVEAAFFKVLGDRAVRLDILERVHSEFAAAARAEASAQDVTRRISSLLGSGIDETVKLGLALGWEQVDGKSEDGQGKVWRRKGTKPRKRRKRRPGKALAQSDSPFADLATLIAAD